MIVELLHSGQSVKEVRKEYNLNSSMVRHWRKTYELNSRDFSIKKEPTSQELELKKLQKELREVKLERDILKKAINIFSKSDS